MTRECFICGDENRLEMHRIIPGKAGGKYKADNVVWLCKRDHTKVHAEIRTKWGRDYRKLNLNQSDFMSIILTVKFAEEWNKEHEIIGIDEVENL